MKKLNLEWIKELPEVGSPMIYDLCGVEAAEVLIEEAEKVRNERLTDLMRSVRQHWSPAEVRAAKQGGAQ